MKKKYLKSMSVVSYQDCSCRDGSVNKNLWHGHDEVLALLRAEPTAPLAGQSLNEVRFIFQTDP